MSWTTQAKAVLQKNLTLALRNRRDIFRELVVPILLLLGLSSLTRLSGGGNVIPARFEYPLQPVELFTAPTRPNLWFAPCSSFVSNVTQLLVAMADFSFNTTCFASESAMLLTLTPTASKSLFAAVVFDSLELPIRYRIRMDTSLTSGVDGSLNTSTYTIPGGPNSDIPSSYIPNFLPLQRAIDGAVAGVLSPTGSHQLQPVTTPLMVQHFPTPSYVIDTLANLLVALVPLYLTFIFTLQVRVLLTAILLEKEKKIRVSLRMQGLPELLYYLTWTATAGVKNTILVTFTAVIVCASGIWARSSVLVVWLFFFAFMLSCIAFCFAASSLFSKSRTGGALGFTLYLLLSLPSYAITQSNVVTSSTRLWLTLLSPCGFNIGAAVVTEAEGRGRGIDTGNWLDPSASSVGVSLAAATAMLFLDALLYFILALYLDRVVQGEFGTVQHPCFCLGFRVRGGGVGGRGAQTPPAAAASEEREALLSSSPDTLLEVGGLVPLSQPSPTAATGLSSPSPSSSSSSSSDSIARAAARAFLAASAFKPVLEAAATPASHHDTVGVRINGLTKVYDTVAAKKGKGGAAPPPALDHLTVDIKQGEVTVLLGHNGAGKTTLASILTGFIPATEGDALVFGRSVANDIGSVQAMIGLCPQHDVLFDQLTVAEHLRLWGGIKLLTGATLEQRIREMIQDMGLEEKKDAFAGTLSGGQKRRLSVAISLIGNPKLLILDEPTSGLDPAARRLVWGAINKHKSGRCTILITHFMDEAEILGDTILLMARGRLRIAGSPLFLKNTFGLGYTLTVTAGGGEGSGGGRGGRDLATKLEGIVSKHVASAEMPKVLGGGEFSGDGSTPTSHPAPTFDFILPRGTEGAFGGLLSELEGLSSPQTLNPLTLSISMATLEECFCALESIVEEEERMQEEEEEGTNGEDRRGGFTPPSNTTTTSSFDTPPHPTASPSGVSSWLDIRRRSFVHGPLSQAKTLAGECGLPPPTHLVPRDSFQFLLRQVKVQLWRLGLGGLRDWRSLALQTALPIVTTGVSLLFRLLTAVNASTPDPVSVGFVPSSLLDGSGHTPLTLPLISSPTATANDTAWLDSTAALFPAGSPIAPIDYPFSTHLPQDILGGAWLAGALMVGGGGGGGGGGGTHSLTLLYNGSLIHSLPTLLNLVDSAALALSLGYTQPPPQPLLSTAFHPLPLLPGSTPPLGDLLSGVLVGFYAAIGFCVIPAVQVSIIVGERESGCKQQQYIMGAGQLSYWVSRWLYDSAVFLPPALSTILILTLVGPAGLTSPASHVLGVASLVIVYGISSCWYTYGLSFLFKKSADAQLWTRLGLTLLTMGFFSAHLALALPSLLDGTTPSPTLSFATHAFDYLGMLLVPPYILAVGLGDISVRAMCFPFAGPKCIPPSPFAWDILGSKLIFLLACIPVWGALVLLLERRELEGGGGGFSSSTAAGAAVVESGEDIEDRDVKEERARVIERGSSSSSGGVELRGLRKVYVSRGVAKVAVCDVSLKLEEREIFGLLGPNGAGKSSLLGMLTGNVIPSGGVCSIAGVDSVANRREAQDLLGYAPQFDALFPFLTAQENLEVYAALNGTPPSHLPALVKEALEALDLTRYAKALSSVLSGGNKRRLSLAAALIASPRVVFLDEVTTGVDPVARRRMGAVLRMAKAHRTIILTTHLVEEAEALCARVGVLVTGRLACLGSPTRLKALYGNGYKIDVSLAGDGGGGGLEQAQRLLTALQNAAGKGTTITLEGKDAMRFTFMASPNLLLSGVFKVLEGERVGGGVVREYGISQAALENVFLRFTRVQEEADERTARLAGATASAIQ